MSAPQIGDVITTAEELDALPVGAVTVNARGTARTRGQSGRWFSVVGFATTAQLFAEDMSPLTLVYFPGRPPRPERVVKAEALTDAADELDPKDLYEAVDSAAAAKRYLFARAERIERGEPS